jgi:putative ATP-binding cassette transporter
MPIFARAGVSMQKVQEMGLSLASQPEDSKAPADCDAAASWREIELVGATHAYYCESEENNFTLGPINLTFRPGEVVFLAGGNGSGKTTLAKLITGLYIPESGEIRLDGRTVDDETRELYRQYFSAVFSDFYLFDELLGLNNPSLDAQARHYLSQLQLEGKVKVNGGKLSTINLSQGQRKRLALLTAYLEDRPFYVFDEWAADQDPLFKNVFYLYLLPELKARGKTVLVISHDDRYYHLSDRLIKLNYGKVEVEEPLDDLQRLSTEMSAVS